MGNIKDERRNSSLKVLISYSHCPLPFLLFFKPNLSSQLARSLVWVPLKGISPFGIESPRGDSFFLISIAKYSSAHSFPTKFSGTRSERTWVEPDSLYVYFKILKLVGLAFTWFNKWAQLILKNWEVSWVSEYTTQSNLQIQGNPYQVTNGIFHRTRNK